jgi:hypothetical protein
MSVMVESLRCVEFGHAQTFQKGCSMTKLLRYSVLALALVLFSGTYAHAEHVALTNNGLGGLFIEIWDWLFQPSSGLTQNDKQKHGGGSSNNAAPEIDPGLAMSGFMLIGGTLMVLRSRRSTRLATN